MDSRKIVSHIDLTPIDTLKDVYGFSVLYFKRDDLYLPFKDNPFLGGGKVRQTFYLFEVIKEELKKYKGIISYTSVKSPQPVIITMISNYYGMKTYITIGVNDILGNIIVKHIPMMECFRLGAEIINVAKIGYNNVLRSKTICIAKEKKLYLIDFGMNIEDKKVLMESVGSGISDQVQNIPDDLDVIIVPVGSGIQLAGIIHGVEKYKKNVKRIIGIQVAGYDRRKDVDRILDIFETSRGYEFFIDKTYPYTKKIHFEIFNRDDIDKNFRLNVIYEAKAMRYLLHPEHRKEMGIEYTDRVLFWIVGNNNYLYK